MPATRDGPAAADGSPERWRRAFAVVDAALELDAPARERLVRERCAGDPALESDVRRWLDAAARPLPLLDAPPTPPAPAAAPMLRLPRRLGPWEAVRFVGAGGMGEVYEAERADGTFARRVALKVVRDAGDGAPAPSAAALLRRFHRERRLLAALDHPGIARLLDAGLTDDGVPYYVMELVDGVPIDAYCDGRRLGVAARVALVRQVCAAVAYAHRRLVVHRDLKPSNVLVTGDGVVKLVDFGIARLLGEPEPGAAGPSPDDAPAAPPTVTHPTARVLTPAYASPEQFRGGATTVATDVYSLSAVLYRLLAGRPPFGDAPAWDGTAWASEPAPPSAAVADPAHAAALAHARGTTPARLRRRLRGDLDAIVLQGLREDPVHRYGSAEALDAELARHLTDRPVHARAGGWAYRLGRLVRRRRAAVAGAALAVAALATTAAAAVEQARRARREADRALEVSGFVLGLLTLPYAYDSGATRQRSLRMLLDSGAARAHYLTRATGAVRSDVLLALSEGYYGLGDFRTAAELARRALAVRRAEDPGGYGVVTARASLAEALRLAGALREATAQYDTVIAGVRRRHGPRSAVLAAMIHSRARAARAAGDVEAAERGVAEAIAIFADSAGVGRIPLANAHQTLGHLRLEGGALAAAESSYRTALAMRERVGASAVEVANSVGDLGAVALAAGRLVEAESLLARALTVKRAQLGDAHPETLDGAIATARLTLRRGRAAEAERAAREALAGYGAAGAVPAWRLVPALEVLGQAQLARGDGAGAAATLRAALDTLARSTPRPTPRRAALQRLLAEAERAAAPGPDPSLSRPGRPTRPRR